MSKPKDPKLYICSIEIEVPVMAESEQEAIEIAARAVMDNSIDYLSSMCLGWDAFDAYCIPGDFDWDSLIDHQYGDEEFPDGISLLQAAQVCKNHTIAQYIPKGTPLVAGLGPIPYGESMFKGENP